MQDICVGQNVGICNVVVAQMISISGLCAQPYGVAGSLPNSKSWHQKISSSLHSFQRIEGSVLHIFSCHYMPIIQSSSVKFLYGSFRDRILYVK